MKIIIFAFFISLNLHASEKCADRVDLTLENDDKITLCSVNGDLVDKKCSLKKEKCTILELVKSQKKTPEILEALKPTSIGRSGSRICNLMKLKVLMGQMPDGSQICICMDINKNYMSCNVPQNHFE